MNLLVIVEEGFEDTELTGTLDLFHRANNLFNKTTFYNPLGIEAIGAHKIVKLQTTSNINVDEYDVLFIPGGPAAKSIRKNQIFLNLIAKFKNQNKLIIAICDAPNVLYENKFIDSKTKFSSFPINDSVKEISNRSKELVSISPDKKLITGKCAAAVFDFALAVIEVLGGNQLAKLVLQAIKPID